MHKCLNCYVIGYCQAKIFPPVNDVEVSNADFVRFTRNFSSTLEVKPSEWVDYLYDLNRDHGFELMNKGMFSLWLDMSPFEITDEEIDKGEARKIEERHRNWFRDVTKAVPSDVTPYVRRESWERFRVFATLLIWTNPKLDWPRILPANDNQCASNDNQCPSS